jgi:hypothetical protein
MDAVGFKTWLNRLPLLPKTQADIMCDCKRVELWAGINLDELRCDADVHELETGLLLIGIDSPKPQTVVKVLMWAVRKYVQFRTGEPKAFAAKAGE